jgi:3-methyladenine DNA glycosylase AlkC
MTDDVNNPYLYALNADPGKPMREAQAQIARLTAERDEAREAIVRLNAECTRLACRNAVLVLELDRVNAGTVRLKQDIEASIRRALYAGEG